MHQPIKAGLLVLGLALWASPGQAMPSYKEVRQAYRSSDVQVLDRQGQLVQRVRLDFRQRRGDWVALEQISPALQMAVLVSEDRRFESHGGVDWLSVGSAAWDGLFAGRSRGASTITMQLAGLMDQDLIGGRGGRSVWQKLDQVVAAQSLEDTWTKPEILEAYLNQVAFRGELVGVDAMARTLFQKQAAALDARESAIAAVLLRGPNASALMVERRACTTLQEMGRAELCRELSNLVPVALRRAGQAPLGKPNWPLILPVGFWIRILKSRPVTVFVRPWISACKLKCKPVCGATCWICAPHVFRILRWWCWITIADRSWPMWVPVAICPRRPR